MSEDPIFIELNQDQLATDIESICINCHQNGITKILPTKIAHFKDVIIMSFECPHCGLKNNNIQTAQQLADKGCRISLFVTNSVDLNRQLVITEYCSVIFPSIELEIPPSSSRSILTTVEGIIAKSIEELSLHQEDRKSNMKVYEAVNDTIIRLKNYLQDTSDNNNFTIIIDDPSGNSYIENLNEPYEDPKICKEFYTRTPEQLTQMGYSAEPVDDNPVKNKIEDLDSRLNVFETNCPSCRALCETRMCIIDIPYFKEVVIMATTCNTCGYKTNEVKSGGAISPKGKRIILKITNIDDLSRDILKSESAGLLIPDVELELFSGSLGGKFTTVEGLLIDLHDQIAKKLEFVTGDSVEAGKRDRIANLADSLLQIATGKMLCTIILDDPLSNSYIQNIYAPESDPNLEIIEYERSHQQNEELGLLDMKI